MCGIAGVVNLNNKPLEQKTLQQMADTIIHRGPDDEGFYIDNAFGLANRRLAIIDLSPAGHQPMQSGDFWITYNGEVYNFLELRKELEAKGRKFKSRTDTEVILQAFAEWGDAAIERFNGMFAFAIWDAKNKRLTLARDRYGVQPLYYYVDKDHFIFASEIKAIVKHPGVARMVSFEALKEYFTFQNILSDRTFIEGVKILPPATILNFKDGSVSFKKYWDFEFKPCALSFHDAVGTLKEKFGSAVKRQMISDVPLGSYLGGGLDTGSIVAMATRDVHPHSHFKTFTAGFDLTLAKGIELLFDERKDAELIANMFQTESYQMVVRSGDLEKNLPALMYYLEDPRLGMSYQNYLIARLTSKFVKVVFDGAGGDEVLGGYPWRYRKIMECQNASKFEDAYCSYWARLVPESEQAKFFTPEIYRANEQYIARKLVGEIMKSYKPSGLPFQEEVFNMAFYFEAKTFLHGLLLVINKINMAHSLEARVPFLDNELVNFLLGVPVRYKLDFALMKNNNTHYSLGGKRIMREAMKGVLPEKIIKSEKKGFSTPEASWYRGPTAHYIRDILLGHRFLERGYFQPKFIKDVLEGHFAETANHRLLIWSLLSFEWWHRSFIDNENVI